MRHALLAGPFVSILILASPALAWWDKGHMEIAAAAYPLLDPAVKTKVNALIMMNPDYATWIKGRPAIAKGLIGPLSMQPPVQMTSKNRRAATHTKAKALSCLARAFVFEVIGKKPVGKT